MINKFYIRYSKITLMQRIDDSRARKYTLVWDEFGRLLHTTAVKSVHSWVQDAALREAGNLPIQGTAAGIFKLGMAEIQAGLVDAGMMGDVCWPLLPIHDEILIEIRDDMAQEVGEFMAHVFSQVVTLDVPLAAEWATAPIWGRIEK